MLGVGVIGVRPARGRAATAHIPALRALPNYAIRAHNARAAESARAAGDVFGVNATTTPSHDDGCIKFENRYGVRVSWEELRGLDH
jgi:predicted dehydrogenase